MVGRVRGVLVLGHAGRDQGWKLHVSATPFAAPVVLARSAEVLVRAGCAFKFARGFRQLAELLSGRCDRGSGGKFMTAYPVDDDAFRAIVHELDRVTGGLPGPVILSDRPVRPGSLVHYRYGVFAAAEVFTEAGAYVSMLTGPAGQRVADERRPWFSPPPWAVPPIPVPVGAGHRDGGVLIGDRFEVRQAIRHSYRGGLFLATDRETGAEVVVKQARPPARKGARPTGHRRSPVTSSASGRFCSSCSSGRIRCSPTTSRRTGRFGSGWGR